MKTSESNKNMKTKFITYAALLVISTNVYSQRTVITNDSLRVHFQNEKPHEVYIYYQKRRFNDIIDYKALYYDHELKGYLMKWLEPDTWIDYELFLRKKELYQFEPDQKESLIRYYVENNLKLKYDSIKQDTSLVNFYLNQAIEKIVYEKEKEMIKKKSNIIPDIDVLFLHARIAYPESYRIIKQWWYKQQKITSRYDGYMTNVFISLLMMNDPDAQLLFNKEIIKLSNSQWPDLFGIGINECLSYLSNAYAVQKLIEILSVTKKNCNYFGRNCRTL